MRRLKISRCQLSGDHDQCLAPAAKDRFPPTFLVLHPPNAGFGASILLLFSTSSKWNGVKSQTSTPTFTEFRQFKVADDPGIVLAIHTITKIGEQHLIHLLRVCERALAELDYVLMHKVGVYRVPMRHAMSRLISPPKVTRTGGNVSDRNPAVQAHLQRRFRTQHLQRSEATEKPMNSCHKGQTTRHLIKRKNGEP